MFSGIEVIATLVGILILGGMLAIISNTTVDRLPKRQSVVYPAPYCHSCATQFKVKDLIPIFSYLNNRGKCPYCTSDLMKRSFYLDISGIAWVTIYVITQGWSWAGLIEVVFGMGLIAIMAIEMEKRQLTDQILVHLGTLGLIYNLAFNQEQFPNIAFASVIGGVTMLAYNYLKILFKVDKKLSITEVKLGAVLGLFIGLSNLLLALYVGIFVSAAYGSFRVKFSKIHIQNAIPGFPTSMAMGTMIMMLFGEQLIKWYQTFLLILWS